jgi:hypothetical protein
MRNPSILCAAALSFALTAPAFAIGPHPAPAAAAQPLVFNRADWDIVVPAGGNVAAAVKKTCDGGT